MIIEIVCDIVCPWCYIGLKRLDRALALRPAQAPNLVWRVFQLNPDMPRDGVPRDSYMAAKFGGAQQAGQIHEAIRAIGIAEGIHFAFDRIERTPNSLDAHRLHRYARQAGRQRAMIERLFAAYFEEGLDIGHRAVLAQLAHEVGLDRKAADYFIAGDEDRKAALAEDRATRRLGINGVPCFIVDGKYALSGAQEPEFFLPLFDLAVQDQGTAIF